MRIQMFNEICIEKIAKVCHETNKAYCETIGDTSQKSWNCAPAWQKQSAIAGVKFCIENPLAQPSANHDSWLEVKRTDGWVYGPIKDAESKEHPCMVPYDELPHEQKIKDRLFKSVVEAMWC